MSHENPLRTPLLAPLLAPPLSPRAAATSRQPGSTHSDPESLYDSPVDSKDGFLRLKSEVRRFAMPRRSSSSASREGRAPRVTLRGAASLCGACVLGLLALLAWVGPPHRRASAHALPSRQQWSVAMHNSGSSTGHSQQPTDGHGPGSFSFSSSQLGSFASSLPDHWLPNSSAQEQQELNPIADYLQAQAADLAASRGGVRHRQPVHELWNTSSAVSPERWSLGSQAAACESIAPSNSSTLAIVGNGPLTSEQRDEIASMDRVMRFNAMNNRLEGERVDLWVVRFNNEAPLHYWGFKQLGERETEAAMQHTRSVLFVGGGRPHPSSSVHDVVAWYPGLDVRKLQQLDITKYWTLYDAVLQKEARPDSDLGEAKTMPSTGLMGLLAALSCVRQQAVHLFGFNWSHKSYYMHQMGAEELIVQQLGASHPLTVHEPACAALYSCHAPCDSSDYRAAVDGLDAGCAASKQARMRQKEQTVERKRQDRAAAARSEHRPRQASQAARETRRVADAGQEPKYGLTPRLTRLRAEVLGLLAEGHRIDQPQAQQVTAMLRDSLRAQGLLPNITAPTRSGDLSKTYS